MSNVIGLICDNCQKTIAEKDFQFTCPSCGSTLRVNYDLDKVREALSKKRSPEYGGSFLRDYLPLLPINQPELIDRVTLHEGQTALIRSHRLASELDIPDLRFKLEYEGPTISLKDRGTSLCVLKAIEHGYDTVCVASSGNNAASIAAYAARAGLKAVVFIQKDLSPSKIYKIKGYSPKLVRVDGDMSMASKLLKEMVQTYKWFECGGPNPYRLTAKRTVVYEIVRQLGGRAPDAMIIPVGGATGIASAYWGFKEMVQMGIIPSMPKLFGVQFAACAPIARAFEKNLDKVEPVEKLPCVSDALLNRTPIAGTLALRAVRETGGKIIAISDDESVDAILQLGAGEGLFLEPAGCISFAGLKKLLKKELSGAHTVICAFTGHGLNAPTSAFPSNTLPSVVDANIQSVEEYLEL